MPRNCDLTQEEALRLEEGGGLSERTMYDRRKAYEEFVQYVEQKLGVSIPEQFAAGPEVLSKTFTTYFWSMVVRVKVNFWLKLMCAVELLTKFNNFSIYDNSTSNFFRRLGLTEPLNMSTESPRLAMPTNLRAISEWLCSKIIRLTWWTLWYFLISRRGGTVISLLWPARVRINSL